MFLPARAGKTRFFEFLTEALWLKHQKFNCTVDNQLTYSTVVKLVDKDRRIDAWILNGGMVGWTD